MKASNYLGILTDLRLAIQQAFKPTLSAVLRSPSLLIRPRALSRLFFSHVWTLYGDGTDAAGHQVKDDLITPSAYGVLLDLGAGHGHTMRYISPSRVTKYVAVEPNVLMHSHIRAMAAETGFSEDAGTLLILSCGAEDTAELTSALGGQHKVDSLVSILTLCSVPEPEKTLRRLADEVLKPGGQLLFYEHVASQRPDVLWWQRFWSPVWTTCFDGCILDRPTDQYIRKMWEVWERFPDKDGACNRTGIWGKEGEQEEHLFWHQAGRLIKRST